MKTNTKYQILGHFLHKKRMSAGLTQTEAAKRLGYKNGQFISNIERGLCGPPDDILNKICELYNIDSDMLVTECLKAEKTHLYSLLNIKSPKRLSS